MKIVPTIMFIAQFRDEFIYNYDAFRRRTERIPADHFKKLLS